MLDFDSVVELMKQYGYSSTTSHPYVYQNEDSIGICYQYVDEEYGALERVKIFKDIESFEEFLKQLEWIKVNGVAKNVRMILDNYESMAPKVMFLRNEKLMVEGEMYEIENFDLREQQREMMDDVSKVIYEAGDLLLVYDEMKGRQLQYLQNIIKLKNSMRQKYYDLQKEVDEYNHNKVERELILLPEIADSGINETLEIALKDKYNMYIADRPPYEEACEFLKEVWELCKQLELNLKYYDAQKEENDIHNELKIVNQKLELMNKLNDEGRPLFGIDLGGQFRKINKICMSESTSISDEWIHEQVENIERKYSVFDHINILNTSDYLREAIQNSNYDDLAIKYTHIYAHDTKSTKLPLNEVAANLSVQYHNSLTPAEQGILVLYNNQQYRKLCDAILRVEEFEKIPIKKLISIISKTKGYSKIKSIVYDAVKKRLADPSNVNIKNSVFGQFDFSSYESFIKSIINSLVQLKNINTKMMLSGDINMYLVLGSVDEIKISKFTNVTSALNDLLSKTKGTDSMIGIALLKANTPVLYSPFYLDIGDVYAKGASLQMQIKEMADFELLVDCSDILIAVDPKQTNVVRYYSIPKAVDNISVVSDIKMSFKTTFCKFAFTSKLLTSNQQVEVSVASSTVPNGSVVEQSIINQMSTPVTTPVVDSSAVTSSAPVQPSTVPVSNSVSTNNGITGVESVKTNEPVSSNKVNGTDVKPDISPLTKPIVNTVAIDNKNVVSTPVSKQQVTVSQTSPVGTSVKTEMKPANVVQNGTPKPQSVVSKPASSDVKPQLVQQKDTLKSEAKVAVQNQDKGNVINTVAKPVVNNNPVVNKDKSVATVAAKPAIPTQKVGVAPVNKVLASQPVVSNSKSVQNVVKSGEVQNNVTRDVPKKEVPQPVKPINNGIEQNKVVQGSAKLVETVNKEGTSKIPGPPLVNNKMENDKKSVSSGVSTGTGVPVPSSQQKTVLPDSKMVAKPLPVPNKVNPEKKQIVVDKVGTAFKPKDSNGNSQVSNIKDK